MTRLSSRPEPVAILVDDRIGSKHLVKDLRKLGAVCELTRLEYGDCSILGYGPEGKPLAIGVELKTINDFLTSFERGRLQDHQIPGLVANYDAVYVVIEGVWRPDANGNLEILFGPARDLHSSKWRYSAVAGILTSLESRRGVRVRRTGNTLETAYTIHGLWTSYSKEWDRPTSVEACFGVDIVGNKLVDFGAASLVKRTVSQWPGVGSVTARKADKEFKSVVDAVDKRSEKRWAEVLGSKKVAADLMASLNGRGKR